MAVAGNSARSVDTDFMVTEDGFQDDDLLSHDELPDITASTINYLDDDNDYEAQLGSPSEDDVLGEDFGDMKKYKIVDVVEVDYSSGNDRASRIIVTVYAMRLPSNNCFDHDKFLRYLKWTLNQYVDQDYTIIYFHYGLNRSNKPPLKWLIKAYRDLDRNYKKNLKALYIVHPTRFIRIVWNIFKPFISSKFEKKLQYVNYLSELEQDCHTDQLLIPGEIKAFDFRSLPPGQITREKEWRSPSQQFGVSLVYILENHPRVINDNLNLPPVVLDMVAFLRSDDNLYFEGIFRRTPSMVTMKQMKEQINAGRDVSFPGGAEGAIMAASLLKAFLRELECPLFPFEDAMKIGGLPENSRDAPSKNLIEKLPECDRILLKFVFAFLVEVSEKSDANRMNAVNLANCIGPSLTWGKMSQGYQMSINQIAAVNSFVYRLLTHFYDIFNNV